MDLDYYQSLGQGLLILACLGIVAVTVADTNLKRVWLFSALTLLFDFLYTK
jgi:hypothetical protein